jgi:hypothetical protein
MEWVSPEVQEYYNMFNKAYRTIMLNYHSYLQLIYVDPYTFNLSFINTETKYPSVKVMVCTSFGKEYDENEKKRSLGEDISQIFIDIQKMIPKNETLGNRKLYPDGQINKTKYCKGVVKYHYK